MVRTLIAPSGLALKGNNWVGLDITGLAQLANFEESGAGTPFRVASTGKLEIPGGAIFNVGGASVVEGVLVADHFNYDKGAGNGIQSSGGKGIISIDKSLITGPSRRSGDFFSLSGLKSFTLTNSKMSGAHCAFHVMGVENMTLTNNTFGFDEESASTRNGAITITQSYIKGNGQDLGLYTGKVKISRPLVSNPQR